VGEERRDDDIAIVGMAGRFPGANTLAEYWQNLADGVESITRLTEDELRDAGVEPREFRHPRYVNAAPLIDDMEGFDARFFGYTPREAEVRDPQGRLFLECCHAAVEDSGYDRTRIDGLVGVFGGMANNSYGLSYVSRNRAARKAVGDMAIAVSNNPDYLATTVSYRLGFRGPSINVQTACSTALVAIHLAGQALRSGDCDYALAGAVEVELPYRRGYTWIEGGIYSRTGQIRPFDAEASGTMFGTGVGVVALKRLSDARSDGDHVYAVIRGSAVNNDGGDRAGFTAPGVNGQAQLIVEALAVAEVHPDTIGFIEAHATGTLVGDPIEVAGLTQAFQLAGLSEGRSCPIGSVKANIGHLGPAAGVAGLIKVCLALQHETIPPNINFTTPNPNLDLDKSPFHVVTESTPWPAGQDPRRAGVSSFGIGGTNAHLIIEEAPRPEPIAPSRRRHHTLPVSAKTDTAAETAARRLGAALGTAGPELELADVAYTLQVGRTAMAHRRAVVAESLTDAATILQATNSSRQIKAPTAGRRRVAMMFPGQGTQHTGMGQDLYDTEPVFRAAVDECADLLRPHLDVDIRDLLFGGGSDPQSAQERLRETRFSQPALFAIEYAMAMLLHQAGVEPAAMIGHSIGEYVAATLAGVFTLPDALTLVAARGRLMQAMAPGAMLAVNAPQSHVRTLIPEGIEIAAVNGPRATVVAGRPEDIRDARDVLQRNGLTCAELQTSHAFHTGLMQPCVEEFTAIVASVPRHPPRVPFVSNVTGSWMTASEATDPAHWGRHLRSTVQFDAGVATLAAEEDVVLLEVGPGDTLSKLSRQCVGHNAVPIVASMRHPLRKVADDAVLAGAIGSLWVNGVDIDWQAWSGQRRRVALPTYPFERQRFWVSPDPDESDEDGDDDSFEPASPERCAFAPLWREAMAPEPHSVATGGRWLVFAADHPVIHAFVDRLAAGASALTVVLAGTDFAAIGPGRFTVRPGSAADLDLLFDALAEPPTDIVHAFNVTDPADDALSPDTVAGAVEDAFYSVLHLGQRLARDRGGSNIRVCVMSSNMQEISGTERLEPARSLLLGPVMLMSREVLGVTARSVDVALPSTLPVTTLADQLIAEVSSPTTDRQVGWRGRKRWRLDYQPVPMQRPEGTGPTPVAGGVYLITGGLGGIGLVVAEDLAQAGADTVVLLGRSPIPPRDQWPAVIAAPDSDERLGHKLARLIAIEERGCTVSIAQCDVSDEAALAAVVAGVRHRHGRVNGVYHSAGVAGGGMMAVRTDQEAAEVLSPKLAGTLAIHRLLGDDLDFLVLFSSITAATGTFGQVDYCAANNFLDAFARWSVQRGRPVYSIGWTRWNEFGMAADTDAAAPSAFRQLQAGTRSEPATHPLLGRRVYGAGDEIVFTTLLEPGRHWTTAEHQLGGQELLVGTALLEMIDAAHREAVGGSTELVDVIFLGPIGVSRPTEVRITLMPDGASCTASVTAAAIGDGVPSWTERLRCRLAAVETAVPPGHDLTEISARCARFSVSAQELQAPDRLIQYGPHWAGNVKSTTVGEREELSRVEISAQFWPESGQYRLHPALLDTAVGEAKYAEDRLASGDTYLPLGYDRIRVHEPIPPRFWVHIRHLSEPGAEIDTMDILLLHDDGQEIAVIDGYTERRVDPATMRAALRGDAQDEVAATPDPSIEAFDEAGISADLGLEILRRVLHFRPAPHLIVCPEGIHRNLRRTEALTLDVVERELGQAYLAGRSASQERLVDAPYVAPETELQRALANFWSGSLGVVEIGLDDDFFELGGNSLVAVQLAARMRESLDVTLPISSLFDYPTLRSLAEHLGKVKAGARTPASAAIGRSS
jgi:acyl transferase domain-containing protein